MDLKRKLARLRDAGPGSRPPQAAPRAEGTDDEARLARLAEARALIDKVSARYHDVPSFEEAASAREARLRERILGVLERQVALTDGEEADLASSGELERRPLDVTPGQLPGAVRQTPFGEVHVAEELLLPDHCQGRTPIAPATTVSPLTLAHLACDPQLEQVDPARMLLLDTETTGLVGGTGTVPFLVGIAHFEDQSLHVEQLFLRELGRERPLLHELALRLERASVLVTYNGKTFDWPLLRTRYIMNQLPVPPEIPHLDLLHCVRRVYKRRMGGCRLVHVEEQVLGLHREHDVEGAEIPLRYLDYLRTGLEGQLVPVIEHNLHDLISLAAVVNRIATGYDHLEPRDEPADHLGYARVAQRAGDEGRALAFALAAAEGGGSPELTVEAWQLLAQLERRRGDQVAQSAALDRALEAAGYTGELAAPVHLALAKLWEHHFKDLRRALRHAERSASAEAPEIHLRRLERLGARLARLEARQRPPRRPRARSCSTGRPPGG